MTNPLLSGEETAKLAERLKADHAPYWERQAKTSLSPEVAQAYYRRAEQSRQAADLLTTQASESAKWRDLQANRRKEWPDEARKAADELEERFDISLCSSEHLVTWVERCETAEAERDEARAYARALEANRPTLPQHAKLMTRANAAEATVTSQAVRIAELEKALEPRAPCVLACPDICKGKYRDEGEPCCILRTTLAAQQDQKGEGG